MLSWISIMPLCRLCWLVILAFVQFGNSEEVINYNIPDDMLPKVEETLLSLFNFKSRPKIDRSKVVIPQAMLDMYELQMGFPLDTTAIPKKGLHTQSANTVRSFTHAESPVDAKFVGHHTFRLKFDTNTVPKSEVLKAAELKLYRIAVENVDDKDRFQRVLVNDIIQPGVKGKREPIMRLIDSQRVDTSKNKTLSLDVYQAVSRWLDNPSQNHGILVSISGKKQRHLRIRRHANDEETEWKTSQPLLFTYTDDSRINHNTNIQLGQLRRKRTVKHRRKSEKISPCRRHKMYVNFTNVGWNDWIVAPPGYDAFFCQGQCEFPLPDHMNTTNHAIVQTILNSVSPGKVPKACCVPTQLNAISMLYLDDESKVVLKNYKEMVVIGCGCR